MKILITGGAGYIGSHIIRELEDTNAKLCVYDNLSTGHVDAVSKNAELVIADLADQDKIEKTLKKKEIDTVIHLASHIEVGESVKNPGKFFRNNVVNTMNLLDAMVSANVKKIIFSSTGLISGPPKKVPVNEDVIPNPQDPYTETKLMMERMIQWYKYAHNINYCILRYFNAAGAHESGDIGEDHNPESHLIPNILKVALGKKDSFKLYGNDYKTKDGTCIRDYVHVCDVAKTHKLVLQKGIHNEIYNVGSGKGYSIKEVIETARKVTLHNIPVEVLPKRPGDVPIIYADTSKIKKELGWQPQHDLNSIISSAWRWHKANPDGFKK